MKVLKKRSALVAAAALAAGLIGQAVAGAPANAATGVTIGISANQVVAAPTAYAVTKGILLKNGIDPTVQVLGAAELVPQLAAGRVQFAFMTIVQALQARTNSGIDLRILVASDGFSANQAKRAATDKRYGKIIDPSGICASTSITRPRDLNGKIVAVSVRNSFPELVIGDAMRKDGGDPSTVNWVVVPSGNVVATIKTGKIDAGYTGSGFTPACEQNGLNQIASPTINTLAPEGGPVTAWVTTAKYAQENPQVVAAFQKSMYQTASLLNRNKDKMREAVELSVSYTKAPLESALATNMPYYFTTLTKAMVQKWADLAMAANQVKAKPDVPGILWVQPKASASPAPTKKS